MEKNIISSVEKVVDDVGNGVKTIERTVETATTPARKSLIKRFPILFTLLVTFGVATTFLGFERIVSSIAYIDQRPWLMLFVGVGVLVATGTLYKKLG